MQGIKKGNLMGVKTNSLGGKKKFDGVRKKFKKKEVCPPMQGIKIKVNSYTFFKMFTLTSEGVPKKNCQK